MVQHIHLPRSNAGVNGVSKAHGRDCSRRGFSLIELVIVVVIIGIIAAIAIPRMSRGSAGAADSAVQQNLGILRNAIDMYQTEHNGLFPAGTSAEVASLLLKYSNIDGTSTSDTRNAATGHVYGPYLRTVPAITVGGGKNKKDIAVSAYSARAMPAPSAGSGMAWLYNSVTGVVKPNASGLDSAGRDYSSY